MELIQPGRALWWDNPLGTPPARWPGQLQAGFPSESRQYLKSLQENTFRVQLLAHLRVEDSHQTTPSPNPPAPVENSPSPVQNLSTPVKNSIIPVANHAIPVAHFTFPVANHAIPVKNVPAPVANHAIPVSNLTTPVKKNSRFR